MFKLAEKKTLEWPVTVNVPQDGGRTTKSTFIALLEVIGKDEQDTIISAGESMAHRMLVGWKSGVADAEGNELPFSDENRDKLLGIPYVLNAVYEAIGEINRGRAAARKN